MLEAVGHPVLQLHRSRYAGLDLAGLEAGDGVSCLQRKSRASSGRRGEITSALNSREQGLTWVASAGLEIMRRGVRWHPHTSIGEDESSLPCSSAVGASAVLVCVAPAFAADPAPDPPPTETAPTPDPAPPPEPAPAPSPSPPTSLATTRHHRARRQAGLSPRVPPKPDGYAGEAEAPKGGLRPG